VRKWINGVLYSCRKIGAYPAVYVEREMMGNRRAIKVSVFAYKGETGTSLIMTTKGARLLVKRINQALEDK
jgi:hypothetical protein